MKTVRLFIRVIAFFHSSWIMLSDNGVKYTKTEYYSMSYTVWSYDDLDRIVKYNNVSL